MLNISNTFLKAHYFYTSAICFLFIALSVSFKGSYNLTSILILTTYIGFIHPSIRRNINLSLAEKSLIYVSLLYIASYVIEYFIFESHIKILEEPLKILLLIPLIFILNATKVSLNLIFIAFTISCLLLFHQAYIDIFIHKIPRAGDFINPIQFGAISIAIAGASLAITASLFTKTKFQKLLLLTSITISILGIYAGVLSQSRGSLIAIPFVIIIAFSIYCVVFDINRKKIILTFFVLLIASLALMNTNTIDRNRFISAIQNFQSYNAKEQSDTSTGIRLGLWEASLAAGYQSPILGVGQQGYVDKKAQLVESGMLGKELFRFDNAHNSYLNAFARRGLIGLMAVVVFLGFPIYLGIKAWRNNDKKTLPYAGALTSFGIVFFIANITQEVIFLSTGAIMYFGLLVILTSALCKARKAA